MLNILADFLMPTLHRILLYQLVNIITNYIIFLVIRLTQPLLHILTLPIPQLIMLIEHIHHVVAL